MKFPLGSVWMGLHTENGKESQYSDVFLVIKAYKINEIEHVRVCLLDDPYHMRGAGFQYMRGAGFQFEFNEEGTYWKYSRRIV